jgi:GNAT superfamily N-acetyltransferase
MGFSVIRWTAAERHAEIMAMIHAAFAGLKPPSGALDETAADIARRQREGLVLVAMADETFVGSLFCAVQGDALYLTRMATHPGWRGRGVGRALMTVAQNEARSMNLTKLWMRVRQNLPGNRALFAHFGFAVTGEGADPGRPPYDVMERAL